MNRLQILTRALASSSLRPANLAYTPDPRDLPRSPRLYLDTAVLAGEPAVLQEWVATAKRLRIPVYATARTLADFKSTYTGGDMQGRLEELGHDVTFLPESPHAAARAGAGTATSRELEVLRQIEEAVPRGEVQHPVLVTGAGSLVFQLAR